MATVLVIGFGAGFFAFFVLLPYGVTRACQMDVEDCEDAVARMLLEEEERADARALDAEFEDVIPGFRVGVADNAERWLARRERTSR